MVPSFNRIFESGQILIWVVDTWPSRGTQKRGVKRRVVLRRCIITSAGCHASFADRNVLASTSALS